LRLYLASASNALSRIEIEGTHNLGNTVQNARSNNEPSFNMDMLYKYLGIGTKGKRAAVKSRQAVSKPGEKCS
jgi:putative alpha-1,2-mannosidase